MVSLTTPFKLADVWTCQMVSVRISRRWASWHCDSHPRHPQIDHHKFFSFISMFINEFMHHNILWLEVSAHEQLKQNAAQCSVVGGERAYGRSTGPNHLCAKPCRCSSKMHSIIGTINSLARFSLTGPLISKKSVSSPPGCQTTTSEGPATYSQPK